MGLPKVKIATASEDVNVNLQPINQAGIAGEATARVGGQIADFGSELFKLDKRRRAEEARDIEATEKTNDKLNSAAEFEEMSERFKDSPLGFSKELELVQSRRRAKVLKGIKNQSAKLAMARRFETSSLENKLSAKSFERTQFTKNSVKKIAITAREKAKLDFSNPVSESEFIQDLDEDIFDIEGRDLDFSQIEKIRGDFIKTRVNGAVSGYMAGGRLGDFARARRFVKDLGPRLTADQSISLNRKIDSEKARVFNDRAFEERQDRDAVTKKFRNDVGPFKKLLDQKIAGEDVTSGLKKLQMFGNIKSGGTRILNLDEMNESQVSKSTSMMSAIQDQIAASDKKDLFKVMNNLGRQFSTGQISAEHARSLVTSIEARQNSTARSSANKEANAMIRDFTTSGHSFNRKTDRERKTRLTSLKDKLIGEGHDPVEAAKIALKDEGIVRATKSSNNVDSLVADQSTLVGVKEAKVELQTKIRTGVIPVEDGKKLFKKLQRRKKALELIEDFKDVPTLKELQERK